MQFKRKLVNQSWENSKKPNFGPTVTRLIQIWTPKRFLEGFTSTRCWHYSKLSSYAISRKTYDRNLIKWQKRKKNSFWTWFRPVGPKFEPSIFFSKIWLLKSLDIIVNYRHLQYQKKIMIQSWENLRKGGRSDKRKWFHRSLPD